jgi:uncharacterized protein YbjT (DUF2867 family)
MILITGATGKSGHALSKRLLDTNHPVRVFVRDAAKAEGLKAAGAELAVGDLSNRDSVMRALEGVERAYLVLANTEDQADLEAGFADCAKVQGVKLLVKQSSMEAEAGVEKPFPQSHLKSEAHIKASGLNWTMVRPTFFTQMLMMTARTIQADNKIVFPMGTGKVGCTDVRDVAEVAAKILTEDGHEQTSYNLTGPELLDFDQIADIFSEVLDRKITYVDQPMDEFRAMMGRVVPDPWRVNGVCEELQALADGCTKHTTNTIETLLGRPGRSARAFIEEHKAVFAPN